MKKWEYKRVHINILEQSTEEELNRYGKLGWELIHVERAKGIPDTTLIFKK